MMNDSPQEQDVVDVLTTDHQEVLDLLEQIKVSTDTKGASRPGRHCDQRAGSTPVAEEMFVYPAMRKHLPERGEAVDHDIKEHKEPKQTMKKMDAVSADDPALNQLSAS
jgi:hypothetical protein